MPAVDFTLQLPRLDLPARRAGDGPRLLYLHDELTSAWTPLLDILSQRFTVIAPELPGFGNAERPDWMETIDDMAFLVADIADTLAGDGPVAVVGAGLGGWLAIESAIRGASFSALAVVGAPGVDLRGDPPADYFVLMPDERVALFFDDPACAPVVDEDTAIRNEMMTARLVWQPRYVSPSLVNRLHRVTSSTLVVWGANDRFLSQAHGEAIADGVRDGRLAVVDGAGHFPGLEQPEATANLITSFLGA